MASEAKWVNRKPTDFAALPCAALLAADLALGLGYMSDAELFASRKYGSFRVRLTCAG